MSKIKLPKRKQALEHGMEWYILQVTEFGKKERTDATVLGFSRTKVKTDEASFSDAVEEKPLFEADFLGRETFLNDCFAIRYMFEWKT